MKRILLGVGILALLASPTFAADMPVKAPSYASVTTPWFGYIEGFYAIDPGDRYGQFPNTVSDHSGRAGPGSGAGGSLLLGYRFSDPYDFSVAFRDTNFGGGDPASFPFCAGTTTMTRANIFTADADVGQNSGNGNSTTRTYAGVRYFAWNHHLVDTCNVRVNDADTWGVGPRVGFDYSVKVAPMTEFIVGGSGAVLFGQIQDDTTLGTAKDNRTMYQLGGYVGGSWQFAPLWKLAVGYKLDYWFGIHSDQCCSANSGIGGGHTDMLDHGPFARITYNFGTR